MGADIQTISSLLLRVVFVLHISFLQPFLLSTDSIAVVDWLDMLSISAGPCVLICLVPSIIFGPLHISEVQQQAPICLEHDLLRLAMQVPRSVSTHSPQIIPTWFLMNNLTISFHPGLEIPQEHPQTAQVAFV